MIAIVFVRCNKYPRVLTFENSKSMNARRAAEAYLGIRGWRKVYKYGRYWSHNYGVAYVMNVIRHIRHVRQIALPKPIVMRPRRPTKK